MFKKAVAVGVVGMALALALAASAAGMANKPFVLQAPSAISILKPIHKPDGYWFTGKVTTTDVNLNPAGRYVALFSDGSNAGISNAGINYSGSTPGHSQGYWQIRVSQVAGRHFDAYVMDRYNSKAPFIDELPAATAGAHSVFQEKTITILPMQFKPDGMWLTGKVTTPSSAAGAPNRFVIAFTPRGVAGSNQAGHTRGHGQGYWRVKVNGWAGISLARFDA
jgi:hypothetical protein